MIFQQMNRVGFLLQWNRSGWQTHDSVSVTNAMNRILRFAALPICGGAALFIAFGVVGIFNGILSIKRVGALFFFFALGFILTMNVGWPLLAILEWGFRRYRLRYVFGGIACALLTWLLLDGAFFPSAWKKIWTSAYFWTEWAPRRIIFFSLIGLSGGVLYTAIVAAINRKFPPYAKIEQ